MLFSKWISRSVFCLPKTGAWRVVAVSALTTTIFCGNARGQLAPATPPASATLQASTPAGSAQVPPTATPTATPPAAQLPPLNYTPEPNATVDELAEWLAEMVVHTPPTPEKQEEYQKTAAAQMNAAARKILQLETDRSSDNYLFAYKYIMAIEAMAVDTADPTRRNALIAQVAGMLQHPEMDGDDLDIAVTLAEGLEFEGDRELATKAYTTFSKILATHKDPDIVDLAQAMAGAARRLNLMGNPITIVGNAMDGQAFDWNAYKGRVVLVDFWATWCKPCMEEMPALVQAHQTYKDKGFEVVGISMDRDREALAKHLQESPLPWRTLNEGENPNPVARHYGINRVPAAILVDQEGRVVSMDARGEELTRQLEKLFGAAP